jgi:protein-S-isoprenylcysteine O-methyltransferase Ste14
MEEEIDIIKKTSGRLVHQLLAHSYLIYLASIVIGFGAHLLWPLSFAFPYFQEAGFFIIIIGTSLAAWAQYTGQKSAGIRNQVGQNNVEHKHFCYGPYKFSRIPTQYGLSIMTIGLAVLYGSVFMLASTVLAFLISRFFIIPRQECHLENKYGDSYREYKQHVKF